MDDLARIFSTYFPRVEGTLIKIENSTGTINLGAKNGLVKGMVLTIFRNGEPFYHPMTGEEMGHFENKLGFIELETIGESESAGPLLINGTDPVLGDKVRMSAARISIIVSGEPEKSNLVLMDEFSRFLLDTNRFLIPSFPKMKNETVQSGNDNNHNEPIYEFIVKSFPDRSVQIKLMNLPFKHLIEQLTGNAGRLQE